MANAVVEARLAVAGLAVPTAVAHLAAFGHGALDALAAVVDDQSHEHVAGAVAAFSGDGDASVPAAWVNAELELGRVFDLGHVGLGEHDAADAALVAVRRFAGAYQ